MTLQAKAPRIFLSYSITDRDFVDTVRSNLIKSGARIIDDNVKTGETIISDFRKALNNSDIVVFFVPPHEGAGQWALAELGAAKALNKNVLAVLPDRARYRNRNSLLPLFDYEVVDAAAISLSDLTKRILESAEVEVAA
jgi:nucleoside 2-deoxyribosyltransferase